MTKTTLVALLATLAGADAAPPSVGAAQEGAERSAAAPTAPTQAGSGGREAPRDATAITPFRIDIPQAELDALRSRLDRFHPAQEIPGVGWDYGVPAAFLDELVDYWRTDYDWRTWESRLNAYPQYTTTIDGQRIHFIHVESPEREALPLILTHGWPGSILEYLDAIGPLSDPARHGADSAAAFHLVIPSLPGFGFSGPTTERGWNVQRMAHAWAELMRRLGYDRYGVVGNDWGAYVAPEVGRYAPEAVVGVHVQQIWSLPTGAPDELEALSAADREALERHEWFMANLGAYDILQSQSPQTLAHALADSPVGLLAWNSQLWRDAVDPDFAITNVMIYWLTGTVASSMRIYYEARREPRPSEPTTVPLGVARFGDDFTSIRRFAERDHRSIVSWKEYPEGGHWAAHQAPHVVVADIRRFFSALR